MCGGEINFEFNSLDVLASSLCDLTTTIIIMIVSSSDRSPILSTICLLYGGGLVNRSPFFASVTSRRLLYADVYVK